MPLISVIFLSLMMLVVYYLLNGMPCKINFLGVLEMCILYIFVFISSYTPKLPVGRLIGDVFSEAFVIAVISFVINISQAKLMAQKNSYSIHPDQVIITCIIKCIYFIVFGRSYSLMV